MHRIDSPGATADNLWTGGNPFASIPATTISPDWMTAIQEEVATVIEATGIPLDKANNGQLLAAVLIVASAQINVLAGRTMAVIAPYTVAIGDFFGGNDVFGVAVNAATIGQAVTMTRLGYFTIPKVTAENVVLGQAVYWDTVAKLATTVGTGSNKKLIGTTAGNAAGGVTTVVVLLTGDASPVTP